MSGKFLLDWAIMAVSLFNVIILLWLGLMVLLNAERRTWGVWMAGGGMLMGSAFFVSHSAILGHGLHTATLGMDFWWHVGWAPVVMSPLAWYVVMLWYTGFWDRGALYRRQRVWFFAIVVLALGAVALLFFGNPLPSYWQVTQLDLSATPSLGDVPLLILVYPAYCLLCIALSLDALRQPEQSAQLMVDLARRRARPWLVAATIALLLVGLLVAWVMFWIVLNARQRAVYALYAEMALTVAGFDLAIAGLIALSGLMLGQAMVSGEVFSGKILPRRGFLRQWRSAVILAAGYGAVVGWSLTIQLRPIYSLLLSTTLLVVFYALFGWRSYVERDRSIEHLRPFVASQRLYERLLDPSNALDVEANEPFRALCGDILEAERAFLVALGPLAPLVGPPLVYPADGPSPPGSLVEIAARFDSPQTICLAVDPQRCNGATWAVPLWGARGLVGLLLLGQKQGGGLYTQEEIEVARSSGERIIDMQASAEMARRLMALQRQRLAESQVVDQRTRRLLHDDVLPQLHAAMLTLSSGEPNDAIALMSDVHHQVSNLLRDMPTVTAPEVVRLGLADALVQLVQEEWAGAFDQVTWAVEPEAKRRARAIPPLTAEVLFYAAREAIRNAARHGRGQERSRPLSLSIGIQWREELQVVVEDDGVGFSPSAATAAGTGHGLALHSTMMAVVGGTLAVESAAGAYTRVLLTLPQQL
ncbi:MAG: hypothetical protein JW900_06000 [Anaerolineae bacterium]|nr:hypothetical protein [Anaerolineae bacterium]